MKTLFGKVALVSLALVSPFVAGADFYPELQAGGQVYHNVQVLSASASSLSVRHSKGISQVSLASLTAELQQKYGYNPDAAEARKRELDAARDQRVAEQERLRAEALRRRPKQRHSSELGAAFAKFGQAPELQAEVDLREDFRRLSLSIRHQGVRPSCAIHSIISAIEYQYAMRMQQSINLSETYLMRSTCRTLGRPYRNFSDISFDANAAPPVDEGFTLEQVIQAIRGFGLAKEDPSIATAALEDVPRLEDMILSAFEIPGNRTSVGIGNMVHALNARMPVVVGLSWPADSAVASTSLLSRQAPLPGSGHAVTLVGYRCETGKLEDAVFIFRNSWGPRWGTGGYGFVTFGYLQRSLFSAYVLELN